MNIVITAEGIVSAIGNNTAEVLQSLRAGTTGIGAMRYLQSVHKHLPVGEVKMSDAEMKAALGIDEAKEVSRTSLMGMLAVSQLAPSLPSADKARMVLISGTSVGTMDITEKYFPTMADDTDCSYLDYHGCGGSTECIADHFGVFADVATPSTACSSAANAILLGANLIKSGQADIVVAGGTEALSIFHFNGFRSLMILDQERCRPFDATRQGLNLGEGAAYVVLESEESARRRGAEIHAYLSGYGNACDAFHQTASSADGEGAYRAMTEALATAGLAPADIDYVNAHGTGTPNNDQSESAALRRVFGDTMPPVSSTKSFTGHTTSASGSIEAVICLLAMRHGFIPANLGWANQMTDGITPTLGADHATVRNVVCNSFGFGGNDSSLVFTASAPTAADPYEFDADKPIKVLSRVEITSEEALSDIRNYVKPMEARRMGRLLKSSYLASCKALEQAGITMPDAIITGTAFGCLDNSEKLLVQLRDGGEEAISPTLFMQSTHNTIGSNIAIRTRCHGYNTTYSQGDRSLEWGVRDAEMLLRSGRCRTVLVGCHDESRPMVNALLERLHLPVPEYPVHSIAMVLSCGE